MIRRSLQSIGANQPVIALSMSRLGDAIGNSILFIIIPLYADDGTDHSPRPRLGNHRVARLCNGSRP